jgi:hypothetical protein
MWIPLTKWSVVDYSNLLKIVNITYNFLTYPTYLIHLSTKPNHFNNWGSLSFPYNIIVQTLGITDSYEEQIEEVSIGDT